MLYLISFLIGFAFGVIPFSYIIGRIKGIDLKNLGSGNIGATNLGRVLGLPYFILGFILDGLKGFIPVLLIKSLGLYPALAGTGAILGHIFNPLFKFQGGKGISTTIGVAIGLLPKSFLIGFAIWLIVYFATYFVSLASICFAIALSIVALIIKESGTSEKILIALVSLFVIYAHRKNIERLLKKVEPKTILWRHK